MVPGHTYRKDSAGLQFAANVPMEEVAIEAQRGVSA